MSFLSVAPDMVTAAAGNLEGIASELGAANAAAAIPTTSVSPPAADAVSAAITTLFGTHGQEYQALSTKILSFHEEFVSALNAGMSRYLGTEVANVQIGLLSAVNRPAQALLGHPLIAAAAPSGAGAAATGAPISGPPASGGGLGGGGTTPPVTMPITQNIPVFNTNTPLGPLALTLKASIDPATQAVSITGGTLARPRSSPSPSMR